MARKQFTLKFILGLATVFFLWPGNQTAQASCGAASYSVEIGSQQQVPQEGMQTINGLHSDRFMGLVTLANDKTDEETSQLRRW